MTKVWKMYHEIGNVWKYRIQLHKKALFQFVNINYVFFITVKKLFPIIIQVKDKTQVCTQWPYTQRRSNFKAEGKLKCCVLTYIYWECACKTLPTYLHNYYCSTRWLHLKQCSYRLLDRNWSQKYTLQYCLL